jgi:hypothetical protein
MNEDEENRHPLISIGKVLAAKVDVDFGNHFVEAGEAWSSGDWDGVTDAIEKASDVLDKYITTTTSKEMWQSIQQELEDISTIEGCCSVGPPASIPNWISIHESLQMEVTSPTQKEDIERSNSNEIFNQICDAIEKLIDSI